MISKEEICKGNTNSIICSNSYEEGGELRRGPWTLEEDNLLIKYITCNGEGRWNSLAKFAGLNRTGKSCRLRWLNYLNPDIKRGNLTPHEQILILELHSRWGNRWSKIAQCLPGRTDNEIKNYWRTRVQKQARQLKVDSNSNKFLEAVRNFWMPRLVEKMEQDSSSSSSTAQAQTFTAPSPVFNSVPSIPSPKTINMVNNDSESNNSSIKNSSYLTPPVAQSCGKIADEEDGCYYVDVPSYDMQETESEDIFGFSGCHVAENDWFEEDLGSIFSSINEELMQLKKL